MRLLSRIHEYNASGVLNQRWPFDARSCPRNFQPIAWTPWLNTTPPIPKPRPDLSGHFKLSEADGACRISGWCSGLNFSGPALKVRALLDGTQLASATANLHRQIAGDHGFLMSFDCTKTATGQHKLFVEAFYKKQWVQLSESPVCLSNGRRVPCNGRHSAAQITVVSA